MMRRRALMLSCALAACSGDGSAPSPTPARTPASIAVAAGGVQEGVAGEALGQPLVVKVTDAQGRAVPNAIVTFTATSGGGSFGQTVSPADQSGLASTTWTLGTAAGEARAEAHVNGVAATAVFTATIKPAAASELRRLSADVGSSAAGFELADSVVIKLTDRFGNGVAGAQVTFSALGGGEARPNLRLTNAAGEARTSWRLGESGTQTLRAQQEAITLELTASPTACTQLSLAVGEAVTVPMADAPCVVMNAPAERYIIAVVNPTNAPTSRAPYRMRGASTQSAPQPSGVTALVARGDFGKPRRDALAHEELRRANALLLSRLGKPTATMPSLVQASALPNVGDIVTLNIPSPADLCSAAQAYKARARVVYVGTRSIVLEDTTNVARGSFDTLYARVAREFDDVMFPILASHFGNPLVLDDRLDANGRITMLFSHRVNEMSGGGISGFVSSGDYYPTASCGASNVGETFYARVPTSSGSGFDQDNNTETGDEWYRTIRTVIMHEVKHVTSFGEKIASNWNQTQAFFDKDEWLEESSAMLAEELWARAVFGYARRGNVDYRTSIYCEVRPGAQYYADCPPPVKPTALIDHFYYLYQYNADSEFRSLLGPVDGSDFSYYGSGWMFLRWLLDAYFGAEPSLLLPMTKEAVLAGVDNIEARTGKSFRDLLTEFALATALDDYPGFTPLDAKYSIPGWNTRNVFAGLNTDYASRGLFTQALPLTPRAAGFGTFVLDSPGVQGGGMSILEISGRQDGRQLFEFRGASGTSMPAELRVGIARVR